MIKIKYMTVEADCTGSIDFTFDSPEDLARLWSLNDVDVTGNHQIQISVDTAGHWQTQVESIAKPYTGPIPPAPQAKPPIPSDVYYSDGHFFSQTTRQTMGGTFYSMWIERAHEFPTVHK